MPKPAPKSRAPSKKSFHQLPHIAAERWKIEKGIHVSTAHVFHKQIAWRAIRLSIKLTTADNEAMNRKVGARGLRMILEELMLDLMYHLPGQKRIKEFEVTREMVVKREVTLAAMEKAG